MLRKLIRHIQNEEFVFVQTHNFPDHDAVCSAFGLQHILAEHGITSHIIYEGEIQRDSLHKTIQEFHINIRPAKEFELKDEYKIIIVDGCKGSKNVTDLVGEEIAVIDHHEVHSPDDVTYSDIRTNYGSCSTIIQSYYETLNLEPTRDVASALLIGLNMDTALMTRGVDGADLTAYQYLYERADNHLVNTILRNFIQTKDLAFFKVALDKLVVEGRFAFCYFEEGCNQNLLGILGDFFLALEEADFVALCAHNNGVINFSLRSEVPEWNSSTIIREALDGVGFGGGHADMAGGIIKDASLFNEKLYFKKFTELLATHEKKYKAVS
ncbi:MAG: DHH family phosphoesterase [Deltaproteobacteria bacterium]|nr:DHH family phosphoesterase [Deltaproteobacteria bacterium]